MLLTLTLGMVSLLKVKVTLAQLPSGWHLERSGPRCDDQHSPWLAQGLTKQRSSLTGMQVCPVGHSDRPLAWARQALGPQYICRWHNKDEEGTVEHPNISIESRISKITEQLANKLIKTIAAITKLAKLATKYATSQPAKLLTG